MTQYIIVSAHWALVAIESGSGQDWPAWSLNPALWAKYETLELAEADARRVKDACQDEGACQIERCEN